MEAVRKRRRGHVHLIERSSESWLDADSTELQIVTEARFLVAVGLSLSLPKFNLLFTTTYLNM